MPDARKTLRMLENEWRNCVRCSLADRRVNEDWPMVFGEGNTRGILIIGEGPGKDEEATGRPFIGKSGQFLRHALKRLGLLEDVYITNTVICRSCDFQYNGEGQVVTRFNRKTQRDEPNIIDVPPKPLQMDACRPRLEEQIYLVDPILIITLGGAATQALLGKATSILSARGEVREIEIPGAAHLPSRTAQKGVWGRKVRGTMVWPTAQNTVRYLMMPTLHPAFVLRQIAEQGPVTALKMFAADLRNAAAIYDRYKLELYGISINERELDEDALRTFEE